MNVARCAFVVLALSAGISGKMAFARSAAAQRVADVCAEYQKNGNFSGSILVKSSDNIEIDEAYGYANPKNLIPNLPETVFRVGALTRFITATAVVQSVANGHINFDDTIRKRAPELANPNTGNITIHQLLSNTSGIPDYLPTLKTAWLMRNGASARPRGGFEGVANSIAKISPSIEPGTRGQPSSSNFMLLGRILEIVEKRPFEKIVADLFNAAGMEQSGFNLSNSVNPSLRAIGFSAFSPFDPFGWFAKLSKSESELRAPDWDLASSAMHSTTKDMALFVDAFFTNRFFPPNFRSRMLEKHAQKSSQSWFGYGSEIHSLDGVDGIVSMGSHPGFQSIMVLVPQNQITVIVLQNFGDTPAKRTLFFRDIVNAALSKN